MDYVWQEQLWELLKVKALFHVLFTVNSANTEKSLTDIYKEQELEPTIVYNITKTVFLNSLKLYIHMTYPSEWMKDNVSISNKRKCPVTISLIIRNTEKPPNQTIQNFKWNGTGQT